MLGNTNHLKQPIIIEKLSTYHYIYNYTETNLIQN